MANSNTHSYNLIATQWKKFRDQSTINQCIVDLFPLLPHHAKVLDVGCGTGYPIASWLSIKGCQVTGVDASQEMITFAKALKLPGSDFLCRDILTYMPIQQYDAIIAFDSLFHLPLHQQKTVISKLIQSLQTNGIFLMTHGKKHGEITGDMFGHSFFYSSLSTDEFVGHLESLGMHILTLKEDYQEKTTGSRDLLLIARKHTKSSPISIK